MTWAAPSCPATTSTLGCTVYLVSLAQSGLPLSAEAFADAASRGLHMPPPRFEGIATPAPANPAVPLPPAVPSQPDPWLITPVDAAKYKTVFDSQASDVVVTGIAAAAPFTKSGLEKAVRGSRRIYFA